MKARINTLIDEQYFDHEIGEFFHALSFISPSKGGYISTVVPYKNNQRDQALKKLIAELDKKDISHELIA